MAAPKTTRDVGARSSQLAARKAMREWRSKIDRTVSPYLYVAPFFVVFVVFSLFPLGYTAWISLFHWGLLEDKHEFVGLQNYRDLLGDPNFWNALVNTFSILLLSTVPQLVLALGLAHLLHARPKGLAVFRMGMLLPNVTSVVAATVVFSQLFGRDFGMINWVLAKLGAGHIDWQAGRATSHLAIAVMIVWRWTGYNALIYLGAMQAVPRELYESATIDGAPAFTQLRRITIPMIRPTIIFTVLVSTIYGLQIFTEPQLFGNAGGTDAVGGNDRQFQTLSLYLYERALRGGFEFGYGAAIAWMMFIVIVVVTAATFLVIRRIRGST